jgi:hypothetical protein
VRWQQRKRLSGFLSRNETYLLAWLLLAYLIYLPFIFWWDPFEPKWMVVPNLALWAGVAVLWQPLLKQPFKAQSLSYPWILGLLVLVIAAANLTATVWMRHTRINPCHGKRMRVEHMTDKDLLVSVNGANGHSM